MNGVGVKRALLTWDDVAEEMPELPEDQRSIAAEIVERERADSGGDVSIADGPWYLVGASVAGHIGIGETPVAIRFVENPGLTIVTAANGTGKTSFVDGMRLALANRSRRSANVVEDNVHGACRAVSVSLTNGTREVEIVCDGDGVRWTEGGVVAAAFPSAWVDAFTRYLPMLLNPELAPVLEKPSQLHEFLKAGLSLGVLYQLLDAVRAIGKAGREIKSAVEPSYRRAVEAAKDSGKRDLVEAVKAATAVPSVDVAARIGELATVLPEQEPRRPILVPTWTVDEAAAIALEEAIAGHAAARVGVESSARQVHDVLERVLAAENDLRLRSRDACPVCGTSGVDWVAHVRVEAATLGEQLATSNTASTTLAEAITRLQASFPPELTSTTAEALSQLDDSEVDRHIRQWRETRQTALALTVDSITATALRDVVAASAELAIWYASAAEVIQRRYDAVVAGHAAIRSEIARWLEAAGAARTAVERGVAADKLGKEVDEWIKRTRNLVFAPIGEEIERMWKTLNPDGALDLTNVNLGGGTRQAQKVKFGLSVDGASVPDRVDKADILSTGQRNALSLAAYLPRATQGTSPFGFLLLDDPIHAFDTDRVRYLARKLIEFAGRYQVIVFTHDDRLWQELRALGHLPRHLRMRRVPGKPSHVAAEHETWPGELLLDEVDDALAGEKKFPVGDARARAMMTLAMCRQAVDTAVITQVEILGRRLAKPPTDVEGELDRAFGTRGLLERLDAYAAEAGLPATDWTPFDRTIQALNNAAHGRASDSVDACRLRVAQARDLFQRISEVGRS